MYANPIKITRTNITTKDNYNIFTDDTTLLTRMQALFPFFPNSPVGMRVEVFYEGGVDSQVKVNNGDFNDFINGNRYDCGGAKLINSIILSKLGTEYTIAISFE